MKFLNYLQEENIIKKNPQKNVYKDEKWSHTQFTCSKCKHSEKVTEDFKRKYFTPKGDLTITCPKCGQKYFIPY